MPAAEVEIWIEIALPNPAGSFPIMEEVDTHLDASETSLLPPPPDALPNRRVRDAEAFPSNDRPRMVTDTAPVTGEF